MKEKELETSYHILLLVVYTVMTILLDIIVLISGWGAVAVLPISLICLLCWILHFFDIGNAKQRLTAYVCVILSILLYYASFSQTITDIPILLCILIIILSRQNDKRLVVLVALSYILYLAENIFITHYLNLNTEQIVYSRLALGILCLFGATIISLYFMQLYTRDEDEKEALRREAEDAKNETKQFLSNMSHELRTPINVVNGMTELMLSEERNEGDEKKLYTVYHAGKRMQREVGDILSFSELQTGHFMLSDGKYEIVSVVNDSIHAVFGRDQQGLDFAVDIAPDLPRALYGDARRMRKLIVIFLDNAVKFTEVGGGYLYVSKRDTDYGINLNIDIYDTGSGMDLKKREKYRKGVYSADRSMERKKGGLGLGLYIAHGILASMHGFMSIKSSEEGTHVHLTIPQRIADPAPSVSLEDVSRFQVLCFFDRRKYIRREVGEYYYKVVDHVVKDLSVNVTIASSLDQLKDYSQDEKFTHVFVAESEYGSDPDFFENLARQIWVCVFAGPHFMPRKGSRISVMIKPVYFLSVIHFLKQAEPGNRPSSLSYFEDSETEVNMQGVRALVVDDEKMNLMVANGILKKFGVTVSTAESGENAVESCEENDYDIIFMDYMMPGMNGTDAMRQIRRLRHGYYEERPIVVLTANAVSGAKENFLNDGFDEFLPKPIGMKEMAKCMKRLVRRL